MREFVEALCSDRCAGRQPGTPGSLAARGLIVDAFRKTGLEPKVQPAPGCGGANVLAALPGGIDRWVLVAAHYDHLGRDGGDVYRGADDNAAAVAILLRVAEATARRRPEGRGVLFAAFDGEEPPYYLTEDMGSDHFARHPTVPLRQIDMMICMDLVGHSLGPPGLPPEVRGSVFALGAERSAGTADHVDRLARSEIELVIRRADAETIPPLSDYWAFWRKKVPFLFLSCGRWKHYHTPNDTPDKLDYAKMEALARWLDRFVRATCARPEPRVEFLDGVRDDASTIRTFIELGETLSPFSETAGVAVAAARRLLAACGPDGRLPEERRAELLVLVARLEEALS